MLNNDLFRDPPARFAPGYFWIINDAMDADTMIAQLREMADKGARSACTPCRGNSAGTAT